METQMDARFEQLGALAEEFGEQWFLGTGASIVACGKDKDYIVAANPATIRDLIAALSAAEQRASVAEEALRLASKWQAGDEAMGTEVLCEDYEARCCDCRLADNYLPGVVDDYMALARQRLGMEVPHG